MTVREEVAARAATLYRSDLARYLDRTDRDRRLDDVLQRLIVSLDRALEKRSALTASDVPFNHRALAELPLSAEPALGLALVNEYGIGLGNPGGQVVAMGTEAAHDLHGRGFADENCASAILALAGAKAPLVHHVISGEPMNPEFRIGYPGDWSRNFRKRRSGHTWARLAGLMYPHVHDQLQALTALFADAWLVERSMHAARVARGGHAPSAMRIAFLCEQAWPLLRARVLLLYGHVAPDSWRNASEGGADTWHHANVALSAGFLGAGLSDDSVTVELMPPRRARRPGAARFTTRSRTVIWCHHVSGGALGTDDRAAVQGWVATAVHPTSGLTQTLTAWRRRTS